MHRFSQLRRSSLYAMFGLLLVAALVLSACGSGSPANEVSAPGGQEAAAAANVAVDNEEQNDAQAQQAVEAMPAERLPQPVVAEPVGDRPPQVVKVEIETVEVVAEMDNGVTYRYWTFGGTVPGPMIRVRVGDTVELTLKNREDSLAPHSIDLHAVNGPGGGAEATQIAPGESATFTFKAMNPGTYVYHCATPVVPMHIANGMYGLIVVEPEGGLPEVDREFYVMQGDFYTDGQTLGQHGEHGFSMDSMLNEQPNYVVFNGSVGALTGENALKAEVGDTVRIFFGVGGPNLTSSFHVIGEIFDRVQQEAASEWATNVQTTLVPAGGATVAEFTVDVPGTYTIVDHSLARAAKGGMAQIVVEGPENPEIFHAND